MMSRRVNQDDPLGNWHDFHFVEHFVSWEQCIEKRPPGTSRLHSSHQGICLARTEADVIISARDARIENP